MSLPVSGPTIDTGKQMTPPPFGPDGKKRHVLVLSYYFPPMGLSGVQRVSKFVKYLPENGWKVTVLTSQPRGYFAFDESLAAELPDAVRVIRSASADPTRVYRKGKTVRLPAERLRRRLSSASQWIFIPDNKVGWFPSAVASALRIHRRTPVDIVFSSAPPYTSHLVGRMVAKRATIPLVLDFRDDWLGNPRHQYPSRLHYSIQKRLESMAVSAADAITTINTRIAADIRNRNVNSAGGPSITVLPQGYDPADFAGAPRVEHKECMSFLYSGIFYDAQSPEPFLRALRLAISAKPMMSMEIRADFVGLVPEYMGRLVADLGLEEVVRYHGYKPHNELTKMLSGADVLWLTIGKRPGAETISTGKLYEYFGTGRPILGLVPDGVARRDLLKYGAGEVVDPEDVVVIAETINRLYDRWKSDSIPTADVDFVARFDRRHLANRLADLLRDVVNSRD